MSEDSQRNRRRVTKMLVSVTVMFAASWLPIQVIIMIVMIMMTIMMTQVILLLKAFEVFDVTVTNISIQVNMRVFGLMNGLNYKIFLTYFCTGCTFVYFILLIIIMMITMIMIMIITDLVFW